ncbi:MAG: hypothetical protein AAGA84_12785 [Pseudomonadota bacterium]
MNTTVRNILAFVIGAVVGSVVNITLVGLGMAVVPTPEGFDPTTMESYAATAHLLESVNYIPPLIAHAVGCFVGALVAFLIAGSHKHILALAIGAFTLVGGVWAANIIPAPTWFIVTDLVLAYLPMALLAVWVGRAVTKTPTV